MFNPAKLAKEIFSVLRSFDYTVSIFDYDGNRVYEPEDARRFFASPKNLTVSIYEDSENSVVKLFLSQTTDIDEILGLIETMRVTASRYNILFNVRKYQKELSPRDLAPNSGIENEPTGLLRSGESNDLAQHIDTVTNEIKQLRDDLPEVISSLKSKRKEDTMNELNESMIHLPALGSDVESDAWDNFKHGRINLMGDPEPVENTGDANQYRVNALRAIALKTTQDGLAALFNKIADAIEAGSRDSILLITADRAADIVYLSKAPKEPEVTEETTPETIHLPALGVDVEKTAWENFKNGQLDLSHDIEMAEGTPESEILHDIADAIISPLLGELIRKIADDELVGLKKTIADTAIKAAHVEARDDNSDDKVIVTESIRQFDEWFDSTSVERIFENHDAIDDLLDRDDLDGALDLSYRYVVDNFDADDFFKRYGNDFDFNAGLDPEDRHVETSVVKASLKSYLTDMVEIAMDDQANAVPRDIDALVDELFPDVEKFMRDEDWKFDENLTENAHDIQPTTEDDAFRLGVKHREFGWDMQCPSNWGIELFRAYTRGWNSAESKQPEWSGYSHRVNESSDDLATEDVLLPNDAKADLVDEVKAREEPHDDADRDPEVQRIIDLATK